MNILETYFKPVQATEFLLIYAVWPTKTWNNLQLVNKSAAICDES